MGCAAAAGLGCWTTSLRLQLPDHDAPSHLLPPALQTVIDAPNSKKSDLRRARSAMLNLAPTSTGSATAIALIFPGEPCLPAGNVGTGGSCSRCCSAGVQRATQALRCSSCFHTPCSARQLCIWLAAQPLSAPCTSCTLSSARPELKGKLNGLAVRVPLLNASITDCVFEVARSTSVEEVNALLKVGLQLPSTHAQRSTTHAQRQGGQLGGAGEGSE